MSSMRSRRKRLLTNHWQSCEAHCHKWSKFAFARIPQPRYRNIRLSFGAICNLSCRKQSFWRFVAFPRFNSFFFIIRVCITDGMSCSSRESVGLKVLFVNFRWRSSLVRNYWHICTLLVTRWEIAGAVTVLWPPMIGLFLSSVANYHSIFY